MFDANIATWILLGTFVLFIIFKMPVVFALSVSSCLTMLYMKLPLMAFIQQMKWMDGTYYLSFRQKTSAELTEEMTLDLLADCEYRLCMLELG